MSDELAGLGIPNCPDDLVPMVVAGSERHPFWYCPVCGRTSIAEG